MDVMKLTEEFYQIPVAPERHLKMTYAQLNACGMDFDFTSVLQDGKDFHKITQDICVSYQKFHEGHLTNLFFSRKTPLRQKFPLSILGILWYHIHM